MPEVAYTILALVVPNEYRRSKSNALFFFKKKKKNTHFSQQSALCESQ